MTIISYEVEVTGHEAPFKWQVVKFVDGSPKPMRTGQTGEARTYEHALFDAAEEAHNLEYRRQYAATVRTEALFEVDTEAVLHNPLLLAD